MFRPWWEEDPSRLEWELSWLTHLGFPHHILTKNDSDGSLDLQVEYSRPDGTVLELKVCFPPFYPDFRFEVFAPSLNLAHHQNPYTKGLCLLGRSTALWNPDDSLANFLVSQMPKLLTIAESEDPAIAEPIEDHQAEPFSAFLSFRLASVVLMESKALAGLGTSGEFTVSLSVNANAPYEVRGAVLTMGNRRVWPEPQGPQFWGTPKTVKGLWYELDNVNAGLSAQQIFEQAALLHPRLKRTTYPIELRDETCTLALFRVPSETQYRESGHEWLCVLETKPKNKRGALKAPKFEFIRVEPVGLSILLERAPELIALGEKRIAVVGLGCLGAPSAIEFARSGIRKLRLLDADVVEAGPLVRWPLGYPYIGMEKVNAIGHFLQTNYPSLDLSASLFSRIGFPTFMGEPSLDKWETFFAGVDLIYDATAEVGASRLLSKIATDRNIPLVTVSATHGGWGGTIVTYIPGISGCYDCFLRWAAEEAFQMPFAAPAAKVQTMGCAEPTFTGSSFDISQVAINGVRTAVSLLSRNVPGAYPTLDTGVATLRLRDDKGGLLYPTWFQQALLQHPQCQYHAPPSGSASEA